MKIPNIDIITIDLLDKNARKVIKSSIVELKSECEELFKKERGILRVDFYINPCSKPKKMRQIISYDIGMKKNGIKKLVNGVFETVLDKEYITEYDLYSEKYKKVKVIDKNKISLIIKK